MFWLFLRQCFVSRSPRAYLRCLNMHLHLHLIEIIMVMGEAHSMQLLSSEFKPIEAATRGVL